jgi:hypothetical protein
VDKSGEHGQEHPDARVWGWYLRLWQRLESLRCPIAGRGLLVRPRAYQGRALARADHALYLIIGLFIGAALVAALLLPY